jgi:hypothetical protein
MPMIRPASCPLVLFVLFQSLPVLAKEPPSAASCSTNAPSRGLPL